MKEGKAARGFSCISAAFTFDHLRAGSLIFDNHQAGAHTDPKFIFSSINFLSLFFSLAFVFSFLAILTPRFLKNFYLNWDYWNTSNMNRGWSREGLAPKIVDFTEVHITSHQQTNRQALLARVLRLTVHAAGYLRTRNWEQSCMAEKRNLRNWAENWSLRVHSCKVWERTVLHCRLELQGWRQGEPVPHQLITRAALWRGRICSYV